MNFFPILCMPEQRWWKISLNITTENIGSIASIEKRAEYSRDLENNFHI